MNPLAPTPAVAPQAPNRYPLIDLLKALAAQLVLLHHLSAYGPIAAAFETEMPNVSEWLFNQARLAVQIFLVTGGFLCAKGLIGRTQGASLISTLANRYLRLAVPYVVALTLACGAAWVARAVLDDSFIPGAPQLKQWLAHAFLLQGILGFDSLSSGVWYVAIDFQLFALTVLIFHLTRSQRSHARMVEGAALALCSGLALVSLFYFNLDGGLDNLALYFFGTYGLGIWAYWISRRQQTLPWAALMLIVTALSLHWAFRERLALALVTALVLLASDQPLLSGLRRLADRPWIRHLGEHSYALFLVHFSFILLGNALFHLVGESRALSGTLAVLVVWGVSLLAAIPFHRYVERRVGRWKLSLPLGGWPVPAR